MKTKFVKSQLRSSCLPVPTIFIDYYTSIKWLNQSQKIRKVRKQTLLLLCRCRTNLIGNVVGDCATSRESGCMQVRFLPVLREQCISILFLQNLFNLKYCGVDRFRLRCKCQNSGHLNCWSVERLKTILPPLIQYVSFRSGDFSYIDRLILKSMSPITRLLLWQPSERCEKRAPVNLLTENSSVSACCTLHFIFQCNFYYAVQLVPPESWSLPFFCPSIS